MNYVNDNAPVASISSSAMMVDLSVSQWSGRKKDKRASSEVTNNAAAKKGVASVDKALLADCAELDAIHKHVSAMRQLHQNMTLPWTDTGMRIVSTQNYFEYNKTMTGMQQEFDALVQSFLNNYGWEISQAHAALGSLFDPSDYPSVDSLQDKFGCRLTYMPVPDAGDFRVDIGNEAMQQLKQDYEQAMSNKLNQAMTDIWGRAYKALSNMAERLDYTDTKKVFRNTLVDNVLDIVQVMESCNIANDPKMDLMAKKLKTALRGVTPEALREDSYLRNITKDAVKDAINTLPSLDF